MATRASRRRAPRKPTTTTAKKRVRNPGPVKGGKKSGGDTIVKALTRTNKKDPFKTAHKKGEGSRITLKRTPSTTGGKGGSTKTTIVRTGGPADRKKAAAAKKAATKKAPAKKTPSFGSAFKAARAAGKKIFTWKGKKYNTKHKGE